MEEKKWFKLEFDGNEIVSDCPDDLFDLFNFLNDVGDSSVSIRVNRGKHEIEQFEIPGTPRHMRICVFNFKREDDWRVPNNLDLQPIKIKWSEV